VGAPCFFGDLVLTSIYLFQDGTQPPLADDITLDDIASRDALNNWTGADLAALMREAAMQAVREITSAPENADTPPENISVNARHIEHALNTVRPSVSTEVILLLLIIIIINGNIWESESERSVFYFIVSDV